MQVVYPICDHFTVFLLLGETRDAVDNGTLTKSDVLRHIQFIM